MHNTFAGYVGPSSFFILSSYSSSKRTSLHHPIFIQVDRVFELGCLGHPSIILHSRPESLRFCWGALGLSVFIIPVIILDMIFWHHPGIILAACVVEVGWHCDASSQPVPTHVSRYTYICLIDTPMHCPSDQHHPSIIPCHVFIGWDCRYHPNIILARGLAWAQFFEFTTYC